MLGQKKHHAFSQLVATLALASLGLAFTPVAQAQPKTPAAPAKYLVKVRYKIDTIGLTHVAQFDEMAAGLKKLGFVLDAKFLDDPTIREDRNKNQVTGSIPAKDAATLIAVPFVQAVQLVPEDFKLPKDPLQRVQVQLELAYGFPLKKQLEFVDQVRALLYHFGFQEMVGYDHHGMTGKAHTRMRGTIPLEQLDTLLKDIRREPGGWLAPGIPLEKLPEPFKLVNPILITTVLADAAPVSLPSYPFGRPDPAFEKIDAKLWNLVQANKPHTDDLRIEILLAMSKELDSVWSINLQKAAPRMLLEGALGNILTGVFPAPFVDDQGKVYEGMVKNDFKQIEALAKLPFVSAIRLPQPALVPANPGAVGKGDNALALQKSGLTDLHKKGFKGKGIRLVLIDSDFRGWEEAVGEGKLPKNTLLIDLTRERNYNLLPDLISGDPNQLGHGTHCALAAILAAPEAKLILVRIDPAVPAMLKTVVNYVFGEHVLSPILAHRHDDLVQAKAQLQKFREDVAFEHKIVLQNFEDDKETLDKYRFLGVAGSWVFAPRDWLFRREAELAQAEKSYQVKQAVLFQFIQELKALKGAEILSCSLVWNDGYPLGARSALTKWLEDKVRPKYVLTAAGKKIVQGQKPLWFQSAGNTRGQCWQGLFRDVDGNGVMEFAEPGAKLPPGSWTPELNFLGWQPHQGEPAQELPGNTTFRLSLQWTEPHAPTYFFGTDTEDWYLKPLADLQVVILRQRDPSGTSLSEDDFEEVARSFMFPQRLDNYPDSSTYELYVEWTAAKPGRYAVRVEKMLASRWLVPPDKATKMLEFVRLVDLTPTGILPMGAPSLPLLEKHWELKPRLFIQALEGPAAGAGRPVFRDFATDLGSVGVPADGRVLITIGAATFEGKSEPFSAKGPPSGMELFLFPLALAFDRLDLQAGGKAGPAFGTSLATPFAAGSAAATLSSGTTPTEFLEYVQEQRKKK